MLTSRSCIGTLRNSCACCCCNPQRLFNNCLCSTPTFPRNCISCIISNRHKDDEWKCYSRCLTGLYGKDITKHQTDTPLWRRAKRERDRMATSMIDVSMRQSAPINGSRTTTAAAYKTSTTTTLPATAAAKNKSSRSKGNIVRPPEIIIERLDARQCGGPLGMITNGGMTCTSHRMAQLLMQTKLFERKCKTSPYDSVPDVPLAFYPKRQCQDNYGNQCDDEYAKRIVEALCNDSGRRLKVRNLVSKSFLRGINDLYADVGGGGLGGNALDDDEYRKSSRISDMEEFYGYFGEPSIISRRSTGTVTEEVPSRRPTRRVTRRSTRKKSVYENIQSDKTFNYPTGFGSKKERLMSLDTEAVKRYLALQAKKRRRRVTVSSNK